MDDEQVTCHELLPWLCTQQEGKISAKIQEFLGKPSKREKWIVEHLTTLLFQDAEPLFTSLERATLFYLIYDALNKSTQNGQRSYKWSEDIKSVYRAKINRKYDVSLDELNQLQLNVPFPSLAHFPPGSWALQFTFTLRKPYISQDDSDFYILDNPVKTEWVFKVPYMASSQWKGAMRAAMRLHREYATWEQEAQDEQMVQLFGNVKGDESKFNAGRLYFYPTYFDQIGLEVINPHNRKTGPGTLPIYFECVPTGAKGTFTLLYVPLGGQELSPEEAEKRAAKDFQTIAEGIRAMMTIYGFGAKTSSGFGVAEVDLGGATIKPEEFRIYWQKAWEEAQ